MSKKFNQIVKDLKRCGFDFRINDLDETLEVSVNGEWQRMSDTIQAIVKTDMRELGYGSRKKPSLGAMQDACVKRGHEQRYNPIRDYLDSLTDRYKPSPNGPYIIPTLATYFTNPDGQFSDWLFKWMVGAIAKIYQGERNPMLVLIAPQRIGKSYFAGWICPLEDKFLKSSINPDNKDANLRLADVLVWEVEELGATTRRADIEALKAFITKPFIYERPPYGRHPIHKPANASFIGTVNYDGAGFLNDPTGTTRFLACEIEKIDFRYTELDVNDLWAEAFWYFNNVPQSWVLTKEEETIQAEINSQFEITSALADVVENRFEITHDQADFITTQKIKMHIGDYYRITSEQAFYNELARVLKKMGLENGRAEYGGSRGWYGLKKRVSDNDAE